MRERRFTVDSSTINPVGPLAINCLRTFSLFFAEKLVAYFEHGDAVTVEQVRAAAFRMQRRGYDEAQVDAVLDAVVEVMLAIR